MVQKTHKHRLTRRVFPCLFYLLNTSIELQHGTLYSILDEKHAFASLAMFDIQYLSKEWLDTCAVLYPCIKHILKQSMKIVTVSVYRSIGNGIIWLNAQYSPCGVIAKNLYMAAMLLKTTKVWTEWKNKVRELRKKNIYFKLHWKIYPKYFNFGQLLLSSVINIGELLYKHSFYKPSQTPLGQSEPNLITIRFELLRFDCNRF